MLPNELIKSLRHMTQVSASLRLKLTYFKLPGLGGSGGGIFMILLVKPLEPDETVDGGRDDVVELTVVDDVTREGVFMASLLSDAARLSSSLMTFICWQHKTCNMLNIK